jgi:hypothetical protein
MDESSSVSAAETAPLPILEIRSMLYCSLTSRTYVTVLSYLLVAILSVAPDLTEPELLLYTTIQECRVE